MSDLRIDVSPEEATAELNAVLASSAFLRSPRLTRLLSYLCTKYLAGEADQIKEYNIGVEVLERPASFDPAEDAGARVEVHRLRRRLQQYYETDGASNKLRIVIPVGHYVPAFVPNGGARDPALTHSAPSDGAERPAAVPYGLVADIVAREPQTQRGFLTRVQRRAWWAAAVLVLLAAAGLAAIWVRKPAASAATPPRSAQLGLLAAASLRLSTPPLQGSVIRLTCGRSVSYTDRSGQTWSADHYFEGGQSFDLPRQYIARAFDPKLFQSGRLGDFSYHIPVPKGVYELHLGFVESTFGPGTAAGGGEYSRTFDVTANGRALLTDFDIYSDVGGTNVADVRVFKDISPDRDGFVRMEFHGGRAPALINFIELLPAQPHRLNPIRMVAQENFVTGVNGIVWSPDAYVIGGQLAGHSVPISATEDVDIYSRERFGHFDYAIPVDVGTYTLVLHLAEEYFGTGNAGGGGPSSRVFDVFCNGLPLLRNFDILKEAGSNQAVVKVFSGLTPNAQGKLVVSFNPVHNYASLYALEVLDESR